jgi:4-hydroxy-2-oxoheptanedioate aldolase
MKHIKEALSRGDVLWGTIIVSSSPINVEISGYLGYDFTFIDAEHSPTSPYGRDMEHLIRAAYAADVTPFCRVSRNDVAQIKKLLDFGAKGIIAPFINNKKDAEYLVESCLFPPAGNRGGCPGVRAQRYGVENWFDFMKRSNEELIIMPVLERMEAIENLEEILSVPGINTVLFGPFDLAVELGIRPKGTDVMSDTIAMLTSPEIVRHLEYVIKACQRRGVFVANIAWDVASGLEMVKKGCQIIGFPTDNNLYYQITKKFLEEARGGVPPRRSDHLKKTE